MKTAILDLIQTKPKQYVKLIRQDDKLLEWVNHNSLIKSDHLPSMIYSALHQVSNICTNGNIKKFDRISSGFIGCGPANTCKCTKDSIAVNVTRTKQKATASSKLSANAKRSQTMLTKYGVEFNSQREEVKTVLKNAKIPSSAHSLLTCKEWLHNEYITNQRSLVDIAEELGVYYSTVGEYCRLHNFTIRQRTNYSIIENQIVNYITSLGIASTQSDWSVLGNKEIDILVKSHSFGIEVNGLYWHSWHPFNSKFEDKQRHISKTVTAQANNIQLMHVTDYEWLNQQNIIKSLIKTKLGLNQKIAGRKCKIQLLSAEEEKKFLNMYHLQGYIRSLTAVGLYHDNQLLMMMSVGKPRFNSDTDYEILRMCAADNFTVVGGVSKLTNHLQKLYPTASFVSYCDLDKSTGRGYIQSGFKDCGSTGPGYFWTDGNYIISRYRTQKKQLAAWLPNFDPALSQTANMFAAGYRRFFDCGNQKYILYPK